MLRILNFNAYRAADLKKILKISKWIDFFNPSIVTIQEIHVKNALMAFGEKFQVIINIESTSCDGIGICSLVRKNIKIFDQILGINGRIIGISLSNVNIFNLYPKSGSQNKKIRDKFFQEDLPHLMNFWETNYNTFYLELFNIKFLFSLI